MSTAERCPKISLNEKKAVAIIYMLMFGQSQKASRFSQVLSSALISKDLSETGLLNKTSISVS